MWERENLDPDGERSRKSPLIGRERYMRIPILIGVKVRGGEEERKRRIITLLI